MNEYVLGTLTGTIWRSKATVGLALRGTAPFLQHEGHAWVLCLVPALSLVNYGAGDGGVAVEWFGVYGYLRISLAR